jgi:hypothetical protein
MNDFESWTTAACEALDLDPATVDRGVVLDLTRDVAHYVLRPAAPVTAYLLGLAVGRGADLATAAGTLSVLAKAWAPSPEDQPEG